MLSFPRDSIRAIALLATLALTAVACGTAGEPDCSIKTLGSSSCVIVAHAALCPSGGSCTVDASPATCTDSSCALAPSQKLVIPLAGKKITASTPDMTIHLSGDTATTAAELHVLFDGKEVAAQTEAGASSFSVKWGEAATTVPTSVEISFTSTGTAAKNVTVSFENLQCELDELGACHSGGA
jgi:hypothetical protein